MNKVIKKSKTWLFKFLVLFIPLSVSAFNKVQAVCGNTVPDPLNPNCDPAAVVTVGGLANRFIGLIPIVITLLTVFAIARGAIKIILADDADKRQAGFKGIINAALGAALFYSIWLILFLIEYFTGAELIPTK
jgi:hypothetical protein